MEWSKLGGFKVLWRGIQKERGSVLAGALIVLLILATFGSASLVQSSLDLQSTSHFHTGNQAFFSSEAGILHALNVMNTMGVIDFQKDVFERWSTLFGSTSKTMPGYPKLRYEVAVAADASDPTRRGLISSVGFAPQNARRVLAAVIEKRPSGSGRGALYLAADSVNTDFKGNSFDIDGNDHNQFGSLVPGGLVEPGIATRNDDVTGSVKGSLADPQKTNVKGKEFSLDPLNPSVVTTGGPSVADLDNIVNDIQTRHPDVVYDGSADINGNAVFGTVDNPQITYMTADEVHIHANGNATGAGILIVDGTIKVNGTLDFIGWVIVRGQTIINDGTLDETTTLGNATILGSLWTGDLVVKVGGSAIIDFCEYCMTLADDAGSGSITNIPKPMRVVAWREVL